jgi:hypothetical protein
MADTVSSEVVFSGLTRYALRMTNICDGTGESGVTKVDISTLTGTPTYTALEEVSWDVQGFTSVRLYWDHNTDDIIDIFSGRGARSYRELGYLFDPRTAGGTGDILLTTAGNTSGATYDITLVLQLRGGGVDY